VSAPKMSRDMVLVSGVAERRYGLRVAESGV
jgi:hypothetical protein